MSTPIPETKPDYVQVHLQRLTNPIIMERIVREINDNVDVVTQIIMTFIGHYLTSTTITEDEKKQTIISIDIQHLLIRYKLGVQIGDGMHIFPIEPLCLKLRDAIEKSGLPYTVDFNVLNNDHRFGLILVIPTGMPYGPYGWYDTSEVKHVLTIDELMCMEKSDNFHL